MSYKMQEQPFVSIVICTTNRKNCLEKYAFKSIPLLNYSNYEVVVIDDASTDGTEEFVKEYENKIKNLRYVKNKKHKSLCYVRNLGIKNSKGEIIAFIDDDCYVDNNCLNELVKPYLEDKDVMVVGGVQINGVTKEIIRPNFIAGCIMSFRKKVFDKVRFDTNLKYSHWFDDNDIIDKIKYRNFKIVIQKKAIVYHYFHKADYRNNVEIGGKLNYISVLAKSIPIFIYYKSVYNYYIKDKNITKKIDYYDNIYNNQKIKYNNTKNKQLKKKLLSKKIKIGSVKTLLNILMKTKTNQLKFPLYPLLIEIPIKAKLKHLQEEIRFIMN